MNHSFELPLENISRNQLILLLSLAYLFSLFIRLIWVYQMGGVEAFYWDEQLMINTNDGYFFASGAQKVLEEMHMYNPRVPDMFNFGLVFFTVLLVKITPFSLETIILYMPSLISSLVVIPLILIGRLYRATLFGFLAALLGSIVWSYYNRTMTGYYDTDMFSAMAPMFILYFLLNAIENERLSSALYAAIAIFIYPFLYDQGLSVVYAMGLIFSAYMVIFHRKERYTYQSIILISLALMPIFWPLKLALLFGIYIFLSMNRLKLNHLMAIALISIITFLFYGNVFGLIFAKVTGYAVRGVESEGLKFYQVSQTVREAGRIPFEMMANRISGSTLGLLVSLLGYILLIVKYRPFILALPLIGIGVFSLWGGLRFTVYAVPIAAISAVYFFYLLASLVENKNTKYGLIILLTAAMLYPNITHIIGYKVPTVFNKEEVKILDQLKQMGDSRDYVITWWDYGYPIWFYADKNTLIDGGKHNHDNFIVSQILLTTSPLEAARLSRIAVETYVDSKYKIVADTLFKNHQTDQIDVNTYLENLRYGDISLPEKSRDIYLYLPMRMLDILPTVKLFSNLDLNTGQPLSKPFFYSTQRFQDTGKSIQFGNGIRLLKDEGKVQVGNQQIALGEFIKVGYDQQGRLQVNRQTITPMSRLSIIYMESYQRFIILDNQYLNSTYIQMFVFEQYDKELFEPVSISPYTKVYRLKI